MLVMLTPENTVTKSKIIIDTADFTKITFDRDYVGDKYYIEIFTTDYRYIPCQRFKTFELAEKAVNNFFRALSSGVECYWLDNEITGFENNGEEND